MKLIKQLPQEEAEIEEKLSYGENMKIDNNFIKSLAKEKNPIPYVWQTLWNIWLVMQMEI